VTERRTRIDWDRFVQMLLMTIYPLAEKVVLVTDKWPRKGNFVIPTKEYMHASFLHSNAAPF